MRKNEGNNSDNDNRDDMPRFNFTWIYVLIGLLVLGLQFMKFWSVSEVEIRWDRFDQIAKKGDIEKVEIVNNEQAVVMNAFAQLGEIIVVAGLVMALLLLIGAAFLSDSEDASSSRGLAV